jgi:hypothetical protein
MMEPRDPVSFADLSRTPSDARPPLELLREAVLRGDFGNAWSSTLDSREGTAQIVCNGVPPDALPRRQFLTLGGVAMGAALSLAACASAPRTARLPDAVWTDLPDAPRRASSSTASSGMQKPTSPSAALAGEVNPIGEAALPWAKPRFLWAKGPPNQADLNPMLPVTAITVHHDGLEPVIYATDTISMTARIEHYRVGHRGKGWADIGYHLVIDRAGTLWQGRAIRWQGAHVKNRNEGNIGVLVMGNFERQQPTTAQMRTLQKTLVDLMRTYQVPKSRVYTHREWPDADTLCPGKNLQAKVVPLRRTLA